MVRRVEITIEATAVLTRLKSQHGALMFHQSGGCCDGSSPMCYPAGDFRVGPQDVLLGEIGGCESADIPVVIAVPEHRFADWIRFADGMSVKLHCDPGSLNAWWDSVAARNGGIIRHDHQSICEVLK
jgi:uncharacterized protein (DUF779 family)